MGALPRAAVPWQSAAFMVPARSTTHTTLTHHSLQCALDSWGGQQNTPDIIGCSGIVGLRALWRAGHRMFASCKVCSMHGGASDRDHCRVTFCVSDRRGVRSDAIPSRDEPLLCATMQVCSLSLLRESAMLCCSLLQAIDLYAGSRGVAARECRHPEAVREGVRLPTR